MHLNDVILRYGTRCGIFEGTHTVKFFDDLKTNLLKYLAWLCVLRRLAVVGVEILSHWPRVFIEEITEEGVLYSLPLDPATEHQIQ